MEARLLAFLARMLGEPVDTQSRITFSSTQRARLVAWLNENGHAADFGRFKSNLMRVSEILELSGEGAPDSVADNAPLATSQATRPVAQHTPSRPAAMHAAAPAVAPLGLGIDLQALDNLPETEDYRGDNFYARNFTDRELAYCIQQGHPRQSFCGLWAAKEAVVKAGAASPTPDGEFCAIEIGRADSGAPTFPGCLISISHEAGLAVAVCVRFF